MSDTCVPSLINPRRACAARVTVVVLCVCVCVCVCLSHRNLKNGCIKHRTEPRFVHKIELSSKWKCGLS